MPFPNQPYSSSPLRFLRYRLKNQFTDFITSKTALNRLILLNTGIYFLLLISKLLLRVFSFLMVKNYTLVLYQGLSFPADPLQLFSHPWTIITSLFVHANFWHLFWNMIMLYIAGKIFLSHLSNKQLWFTYFIGGILGNLIFMLAYNTFPVFSTVVQEASCVGASGAIMAVLFAISIYRPQQELTFWLIGRIKLIWIALFFVVIDILQIPAGNAGGHFAHLGGALYGSLFALYLIYGHPFKGVVFEKNRKKYASATASRPLSDEEFNARKNHDAQRVDAILDKISQNGYDALTKEEKDFLYNYKR